MDVVVLRWLIKLFVVSFLIFNCAVLERSLSSFSLTSFLDVFDNENTPNDNDCGNYHDEVCDVRAMEVVV